MSFSIRFGGNRQPDNYYIDTLAVAKSLPQTFTLRQKADRLNDLDLLTPSGMKWDRLRLANFLRLASKKTTSPITN
ncbi:hypothetical protein HF313_08815 [Massilia atriviolacea]|uniref:Uncharacterized protein n=1 Tax=Massilia atriviolacea TaxID=2495579 RepID=A0A430HDM4_9BURK|nr:hypothetical protein [Massilia atriviolacea]RSZ55590.1 hypothetical protein EJB06_28980 [Massilia atriviolacea]